MKEIILTVFVLLLDFMYPVLSKKLKIFLFKNRKKLSFRLFYSRVNKIGIPLLVLLNFNVLTFWLKKFNIAYENAAFYINLFLIAWAFYEVFKYIVYTIISIKLAQKANVRRELFLLVINLTKVLLVIVVFVMILSHLGVNLTAIVTSLGIGGVIVGLAAKDTLSNFFDSIRLVSEDAFHQGDWIETKDFEGFVTEIGLTATQIRTFDNSLITIPNSVLANQWIKNWSRRIIGRRIKFWIKIKYTTDTKELNRVIQEIRTMLEHHPQIVTDKKIAFQLRKKMMKNTLFSIEDKYGVRKTLLVYLDEFDDYSMNILVYAFSITVDWEKWLKVKQDVLYKVLEIIKNSKLELAYPTSVIFHDSRDNLWKE
ncbi:mechanosensitive ion channel family protein [Nautilia sp. PV-1]|uniref:mechanosensitive ion channel family protein n=1 Tax=Nautilia sp. PV-1 TaxID=2579250 RepID=UPI000FD9EDE5|nr:mechanosensitive ion channel family protein [Nautilia sp. PV-1]AZV46712.1 mechanosensitive ion channel family protein [Nautilia sp. PV-1]